jgi:hypothetical protein
MKLKNVYTLLLLQYHHTHVEPRKRYAAATHNYKYWWKGSKHWATECITICPFYLSGRHYIWLPDLLPVFLLTNVSVQLRHLIAHPFFSFFIKLFLGKKVWERTPTWTGRNKLTARGELWLCTYQRKFGHSIHVENIRRMRPMNIPGRSIFRLIGSCIIAS